MRFDGASGFNTMSGRSLSAVSQQRKPKKAGPSGNEKPSRQRTPRHAERQEARANALQILFEADLTEHGWESILERSEEDEDLTTPQLADYTRRLVTGVMANKIDIDTRIRKAAPAFPIKQISAIDRNILRIAIYELSYEPTVPTKAAINEAVELAKRYGGENSSRFVNGVSGSIAAEVRAEGRAPAD